MYTITERTNKRNESIKVLESTDYNYQFNRKNGMFIRFGRSLQDDPKRSPFGPEILDIEVSTICPRACKWCYKGNSAKGTNMTLETFKKLFEKFPTTLTQIAFGVGSLAEVKYYKKL